MQDEEQSSMSLFYRYPLAGTSKEWRDFERKTRKNHPFQWFFRETLVDFWAKNWRNLVKEPWYWLKCRVWHRWNVVVCRSLPPTWNDRDQVMLHAAFQLLSDFIEREQPEQATMSAQELADHYDEVYDSYYGPVDTRRSSMWLEIQHLYAWWHQRKDDYGDRKEDDAMFHRLIDVRGNLWT
jgi:hypothetical protein